ncbi:hypothetical protein ScPMuIL_016367 [Solemya velum]
MIPRNKQTIDSHGQAFSQPPPIPPRQNVSQDGYNGPGAPLYGWNLPSDTQSSTVSAWGQQGVRETQFPTSLTNQRQSPTLQTMGGQGTRKSSLDYSEKLVVNMPELSAPRHLITLDSKLNPPVTKTYSSELEGIDFTPSDPHQNLRDSRVYSSSAEDLRTSGSSNTYPDIRHMFKDVQAPSEPVSAFNSRSPVPLASCSGYGWNPFVYNPNTSVTDYSYTGYATSSIPPFSPAPFTPGGAYSSQMMQNANRNPFLGYNNRPESLAFESFVQETNASTNSPTNCLPRSQSCSDIGSLDFEPNDDDPGECKTNGDLMQLDGGGTMEEEYMSLDYFDPLYAKSRQDSISQHKYEGIPQFSFFETAQHYSLARNVPFLSDSWDSLEPAKEKTGVGLYPSLNVSTSLNEHDGMERQVSVDSDNSLYHDYTELDLNMCQKPDNVLKEDYEALLRTKSGKLVNDSDKNAPSRPAPPAWRMTKISDYEPLRKRMFVDPESESFCQMVADLKSKNKSTDEESNLGFLISPMCDIQQDSMSVKVVVHSDYAEEPIPFTCDIHSRVEHVISHVLYSCLGEANVSRALTAVDYILKVYDRSEYLLNDIQLSKYEYIHHCLKLDLDMRFQLMRRQDVSLPFLRTIDDDVQYLYFPKDYIKTNETTITRDQLDILMETFYGEIEKLRNHILQGDSSLIQSKGLNQSVKAICSILAKIETIEITKKLQKAEHIVGKLMVGFINCFIFMLNNIVHDLNLNLKNHMAIKCSLIEELEDVLEQLLVSVKQLVRMFCQTFHTDFLLGSSVEKTYESQDLHLVEHFFLVHIATCHRIPIDWPGKYDEYKIVCSLHHGRKRLSDDKETTCAAISHTGLCDRIFWDEWLHFDSVSLCVLPRETRLCLTLCGLRNIPNTANTTTNNESLKVKTALGGVTVQLFSQKEYLLQGSHMVPLKMNSVADPFEPVCSVLQPDSVLLQFNLPEFGHQIIFPPVLRASASKKKSFDILLPEIQDRIKAVMQKDSVSSCEADDLEILWSYRHYLYDYPCMLPWLLQAAHSWDWACLTDTYHLLNLWKTLEPMQSLELLLPEFPDIQVRKFAVDCLRKMPTDVLIDFIPQLIQALKYESYHNSALANLLLEQSCKNVRFAHHFFWLLKGAAQDLLYKRRYELMFVALVSVAGESLYQAFRKQEDLMKSLNTTAEKVQSGKDKDAILTRELGAIFELFEEKGNIHLPFNPGLEVASLDLKSCSYFTSNAFPLKLVFKNSNIKADPVYAMIKVGDDLRQDMLTMQMVRIMDRLWLKEGLDLKMITFSCLATGPRRGIIELVTGSETLRKIQVSSGVTGSFKDSSIKDWLQKHNPTELEYQKAVENFTYSCAGYCVATYVLGVCDRHNDNIMLKQTGHMFHIDFNRFLGNAQMFGNIKRDRVAFVLTSDMAFVINNGERAGDRFQHFVDICCQAFNILRRNANLFLSLFSLMSRSGIAGLSEVSPRYIQRALLTDLSDAKASAEFTRMMEDSLKSVFTPFNFFLHNLAQHKFSNHNEGALLGFVPKTYSMNTDGKINKVVVHGYQKRYSPEKQYIFILMIERENQKVPTYIFRLFNEFVEFRNKLVQMFPRDSWPPVPSRVVIGRSQVHSVAENRKNEIEKFLSYLWTKAPEISQSDLVYTFFHSLYRDEQDIQKDKACLPKLRENPVQVVRQQNHYGMVKLSIEYNKDKVQIMVMHAKDLLSTSSVLPSPYVKIYLLPDPEKQTKRKTKVVKNSTHPTYNEVIEYKVYKMKSSTRHSK